jgi:hypothetical protein
LADPGRLSLCGGVALYLLGHLAVRWRLLGSPFRTRSQGGMANVGVAAALLLLFALGGGLPAWAVTGAAAALVTLLCTVQMVAD